MSIKGALVLTTVADPVALKGYRENFASYGHLDKVRVFVIPDRKTPPAAYYRCASLASGGLQVACPSLEEQESFLRRVGLPSDFIPYDSDNRRNVGFLMALDWGADFIMSVDDDNFCTPRHDFFSEHSVVCKGQASSEVVDSPSGWFNICGLLQMSSPCTTYARGFPYYARHKNGDFRTGRATVDVQINAGLWVGAPDLDGITWLVNPVCSTDFSGGSVVLGGQTWSPVNTQNTALRRDLMASYYFPRMGYPVAGIPIDRYGDILSGYFTQACMHRLGGSLRVGTPVAEHRRNNHSYMKDALHEWGCILLLEDLLPWLTQEVKLCGDSYLDAYTSLSHEIEEVAGRFKGPIWTETTRDYLHQIAHCMRQWAQVCRSLG